MAFEVTRTQDNRGSKVLTAIFVAVAIALGGGGYAFWTDRAGHLRHLQERDGMAVASVWAELKQGVDPKFKPALVEGLEKGQPTLRAACATALGALRDPDAVAELGQAATKDASPAVRRSAIEALELVGSSLAQPYVRAALDDPDLEVEGAACRAAGGLGLRELVVLVIEKLGHSDAKLRLAAQAGLERFLRPGDANPGQDVGAWNRFFAGR